MLDKSRENEVLLRDIHGEALNEEIGGQIVD
jgi:hypothetical protein